MIPPSRRRCAVPAGDLVGDLGRASGDDRAAAERAFVADALVGDVGGARAGEPLRAGEALRAGPVYVVAFGERGAGAAGFCVGKRAGE